MTSSANEPSLSPPIDAFTKISEIVTKAGSGRAFDGRVD